MRKFASRSTDTRVDFPHRPLMGRLERMKQGYYGSQQSKLSAIAEAVRTNKGTDNWLRRVNMQSSRNADHESRYVTRPKRVESVKVLARHVDAAVAKASLRVKEIPSAPKPMGAAHYRSVLASV